MKNFKDARRRIKQQALQALGAAEATEDSGFKDELDEYKDTCRAVKSLRKSMACHLDAIRNMHATSAALTVELAAFHQNTEAAMATVAFGQAHAETERVQLASVERLYEEEVKAATELLLWQSPEVEEKVRDRKKLLLDYDAHLRKYEALTRSELALDAEAKRKKALFARRKTEGEIAEEMAQRKVKVEQAEQAVDHSTKWLLEQFAEMATQRQGGTMLAGPMSAMLACELHLAKETTRRLEALKPMFDSVDMFCATLERYDKEPPKPEALDVEGVAHIANLGKARGKKKKRKPGEHGAPAVGAFGAPLDSGTPAVVCDCVAFIRRNGLDTEGLFRVPGNKEIVDALRALYDSGEAAALTQSPPRSVHDVCTLLKLWLRELPDPLIPSEQYGPLMELLRADPQLELPATAAGVVQLAKGFPRAHSELLGFISNFLRDVAAQAEHNRMTPANLATCFAPSLMRAPEDTPAHEVLRDMPAAIAAVKAFVLHADQLTQPRADQVAASTHAGLLEDNNPAEQQPQQL